MNKTEQDQLKKEAAIKAAKMVEPNSVLGVGTGSTVAFFIDALGERKEKEGFRKLISMLKKWIAKRLRS